MNNKPLFIVDMTIFEFLHILKLIDEVHQESLKSNYSTKDKKKRLKQKILNMFGKIPIDIGKPPRSLMSSKEKMAQNFMITVNQLNLIEDYDKFLDFYGSMVSNKSFFFLKLRSHLLKEGKWMDYIRAMEKVNQKKNFRTMNEYLDLVSTEIYRKYPHSSVKGHKKQLGYVLRWMKDDRLKIIGDFSANGLEIHISLFLK